MPKSVRSVSAESNLPSGMRSTRATRALLALLRSNAQQKYSAAEVEAALARLGVAVNRVTVFRALDRLAQAGLLRKRVDSDRVNRYQWQSVQAHDAADLTTAEPQPTITWTCDVCHTQRTIAIHSSVQLAVQVLAQASQAASVQVVALHGVCDSCHAD